MFRLGRLPASSGHDQETRTELDSHADACVVGRNSLMIQDFNRPVDVTGYDPTLGVKGAFELSLPLLPMTTRGWPHGDPRDPAGHPCPHNAAQPHHSDAASDE